MPNDKTSTSTSKKQKGTSAASQPPKKQPNTPSPSSPPDPVKSAESSTDILQSLTIKQLELMPDTLNPVITQPLADTAEDNTAKIQLWKARAAQALHCPPDKVPDVVTLRAALLDLRSTGEIFAGVYRATVAFIMHSQLSRKSVQTVAKELGFPDSRISEFCRIAFGPEPIRKGFVEGGHTFRAALRAARETTKKRRNRATPPSSPQKLDYDIAKFTNAEGVAMLRILIHLPASAKVCDPIIISPEAPMGESLRWSIRITQI